MNKANASAGGFGEIKDRRAAAPVYRGQET